MEHLTFLLNVDKVSAEILFNGIKAFFDKNNVPWKNLMPVLLDSCNVMRGSKAGLETKR